MCWDLGLGDELCHLITNAPRQIPDIAVPLWNMKKIMGASSLTHREGCTSRQTQV